MWKYFLIYSFSKRVNKVPCFWNILLLKSPRTNKSYKIASTCSKSNLQRNNHRNILEKKKVCWSRFSPLFCEKIMSNFSSYLSHTHTWARIYTKRVNLFSQVLFAKEELLDRFSVFLVFFPIILSMKILVLFLRFNGHDCISHNSLKLS